MKYILRDIILLIKGKSLIFFITMVSIMTSVFLLHFSYSLFQSSMKQKEAEKMDKKSLTISFNGQYKEYDKNEVTGFYRVSTDEKGEYASVKDLKNMINELSEDFQNSVINVGIRAIVDDVPLYFYFDIQDHKIIASDFYKKNMETNHLLEEGRFFTKNEYETGEKVAIIYDYTQDKNTKYLESISMNDGKFIVLENQKYKVIGTQQLYVDQPIIPITSVSDDEKLYGYLEFEFESQVNSIQYNELKEVIELCLGENGSLEYVSLPDQDKIYLYNTMMAIAVFIAIISSLNFVILYQYLIENRKKEMKAFLICGLRKSRVIMMNIFECTLLTVPIYLITVLLYDTVFLKSISQYYPYINEHNPIILYFVFFVIYYVSSLLILFGSLYWTINNAELNIGGGRK